MGIIAIVIMVFAATAVVAQTVSTQWTDYNVPLTATVASSNIALNITSDANAANTVAGHNFGAITVGQSYEWTFYIYNSGSVGVTISYLPTTYGSGQTSIGVSATVVEYGVKGEMPLPNLALTNTGASALPYSLPEKDTSNPNNGFYLMPTKMIKVDVKITIYQLSTSNAASSDDGTPGINIPFEIATNLNLSRAQTF